MKAYGKSLRLVYRSLDFSVNESRPNFTLNVFDCVIILRGRDRSGGAAPRVVQMIRALRANLLVIVSIIGQTIDLGFRIFIAHQLSIAGLETYVLASLLLILLRTLSLFGIEKLTLQQ